MEKAEAIANGTKISLKDLITDSEWERVMKRAGKDMKKPPIVEKDGLVVDGVEIAKLKAYLQKDDVKGRMLKYLLKQDQAISFDELRIGLNYEKTEEQFMSNVRSGQTKKSRYGKLWVVENYTIRFNPNLKSYV